MTKADFTVINGGKREERKYRIKRGPSYVDEIMAASPDEAYAMALDRYVEHDITGLYIEKG